VEAILEELGRRRRFVEEAGTRGWMFRGKREVKRSAGLADEEEEEDGVLLAWRRVAGVTRRGARRIVLSELCTGFDIFDRVD
jgi:hypothetical protein